MKSRLISIILLCPLAFAGPHDVLEHQLGDVIRAVGDSRWSIEDGVLIPERGEERAYVVTTARYADVEIALEFNPDAGTNSGVFARCQGSEGISPLTCYEFNIWDSTPTQEYRTGAIVRYAPPLAHLDTEGRWNTMRIRLQGTRLQVWVNDTLTGDLDDDKLSEGLVAFQYGGDNGMVKFRNIRIEPLD